VAVNVDPLESDLRAVDEEGLRGYICGSHMIFIDDIDQLPETVQQWRWGRELWREVLLLALAVLMVEMILARESRKRGASTQRRIGSGADAE
jgi:hypothetical protein